MDAVKRQIAALPPVRSPIRDVSVPASIEEVQRRAARNSAFFHTTYLVVIASWFALAAYVSRALAVFTLLGVALVAATQLVAKPMRVAVQGHAVTDLEKDGLCAVLVFGVLVATDALHPLLWATLVPVLVCGLHSVLVTSTSAARGAPSPSAGAAARTPAAGASVDSIRRRFEPAR